MRAGRVGGSARRGDGGRPSPDRYAAADRLGVVSEDLAIDPGEIVPHPLPDLFAGSPLLILGRYCGRPGGHRIDSGGGCGRARTWSEPVIGRIVKPRDRVGLGTRPGSGQLEDRYASGDHDRIRCEKAIVAVSLKYRVLCRFTAYVAIDRSQVANEGGTLHRITQPVEQPEGWGESSIDARWPIAATRADNVRKSRSSGQEWCGHNVPRLSTLLGQKCHLRRLPVRNRREPRVCTTYSERAFRIFRCR